MAKKLTKAEMAEIVGWGYRIASRGGMEFIQERFPHWCGYEKISLSPGSVDLVLKNGQEFTVKVTIPRRKKEDSSNE